MLALDRALALVYRGSPRLVEALDLLAENSYEALRRKRAALLTGPLTWARVCAVAIEALAKAFLHGGVDSALAACEDAHLLAKRLRERDQHVNARVTAGQRRLIGWLEAVARCFEAAAAVRDGTVDDLAVLSIAGALRMRWYALRREMGSEAESDWVLTLVQEAVGRVLSSGSDGARAMATRVLAAWVPEATPPPDTSPHLSPSPRASPTQQRITSSDAPPPKRLVQDGGVAVQWTDGDDMM